MIRANWAIGDYPARATDIIPDPPPSLVAQLDADVERRTADATAPLPRHDS